MPMMITVDSLDKMTSYSGNRCLFLDEVMSTNDRRLPYLDKNNVSQHLLTAIFEKNVASNIDKLTYLLGRIMTNDEE